MGPTPDACPRPDPVLEELRLAYARGGVYEKEYEARREKQQRE